MSRASRNNFPRPVRHTRLAFGHASPRIARPAVKTRAGVPFVDTLGVTNRVPPPIDARVCRRYLTRPRNGGRDLSGRREVSSSTFESPEAAQTKTLNPGFVGSQTPLPRRAVIRSTSNLRRHIWRAYGHPRVWCTRFFRIFYPRRVKILIGSFREIDFLKYLHLQTVNLRHFLEAIFSRATLRSGLVS